MHSKDPYPRQAPQCADRHSPKSRIRFCENCPCCYSIARRVVACLRLSRSAAGVTQRNLRTGDGEGAAGGPQPSCCPPRSTRSCTCSSWRSQTRPPSRLHRWFRGGTRTRSSAPGSSLACAEQRDQALHRDSQGESRTGGVERVCSSSVAPRPMHCSSSGAYSRP